MLTVVGYGKESDTQVSELWRAVQSFGHHVSHYAIALSCALSAMLSRYSNSLLEGLLSLKSSLNHYWNVRDDRNIEIMVIGFGRHACRTGWDHDHFGYDCHVTCHLCVSDFAVDRKSKSGQAEELIVRKHRVTSH